MTNACVYERINATRLEQKTNTTVVQLIFYMHSSQKWKEKNILQQRLPISHQVNNSNYGSFMPHPTQEVKQPLSHVRTLKQNWNNKTFSSA